MPARPFSRLAVILAAGFLAASSVAAVIGSPSAFADDALPPLVHIAADQFPSLKTKIYNSNFALDGAAGNAVIRSRYGSDTGSDGEKVFVFGYQLDLKNTYVLGGTPGISAVTLDLPQMPTLTSAAKMPSEARLYVIDETDGSDAGIAVQSVQQQGNKLIFTFTAPLRAGKQPGTGDHSVWFGLITAMHAKRGPVTMTTLTTSAQPPSGPSLAAGAKPVAGTTPGPATANTSTSAPVAPEIDVFLPQPDQPAAAPATTAPAATAPATTAPVTTTPAN